MSLCIAFFPPFHHFESLGEIKIHSCLFYLSSFKINDKYMKIVYEMMLSLLEETYLNQFL